MDSVRVEKFQWRKWSECIKNISGDKMLLSPSSEDKTLLKLWQFDMMMLQKKCRENVENFQIQLLSTVSLESKIWFFTFAF